SPSPTARTPTRTCCAVWPRPPTPRVTTPAIRSRSTRSSRRSSPTSDALMQAIPDRYKSRKTGEALTTPSAIVLAGAGAAVGIVAGLPLLAAAGVGAAAWAARVAFALPRRTRVDRIDPFRLSEPWRLFVKDAQAAQTRFDRTVERMMPGPLQDRLRDVAARVGDGVRECWRIACQGNELQDADQQRDVQSVEAELK